MSVTVTRRAGQPYSYRRGRRPPGFRALALVVVAAAVAVVAVSLAGGGGGEDQIAVQPDARVVGASRLPDDGVALLLAPSPAEGAAQAPLSVWRRGNELPEEWPGDGLARLPEGLESSPGATWDNSAAAGPDGSLLLAAPTRSAVELIKLDAAGRATTRRAIGSGWTIGSSDTSIAAARLAPSSGAGLDLKVISFDGSDAPTPEAGGPVLGDECPEADSCPSAQVRAVWPNEEGDRVLVVVQLAGGSQPPEVVLIDQPLPEGPPRVWTIEGLSEVSAAALNDANAVVAGPSVDDPAEFRSVSFSTPSLPASGSIGGARPLPVAPPFTGLVPSSDTSFVVATAGAEETLVQRLTDGRLDPDFGDDGRRTIEKLGGGRLVSGGEGYFVAGAVPGQTPAQARLDAVTEAGELETPE